MLPSGDNVTQITANISDGHETEADKQTVQAKHSHRLLVFIPGHKTINGKSFPVPCLGVKGVLCCCPGESGEGLSLTSINLWLAMGWNVLQVENS